MKAAAPEHLPTATAHLALALVLCLGRDWTVLCVHPRDWKQEQEMNRALFESPNQTTMCIQQHSTWQKQNWLGAGLDGLSLCAGLSVRLKDLNQDGQMLEIFIHASLCLVNTYIHSTESSGISGEDLWSFCFLFWFETGFCYAAQGSNGRTCLSLLSRWPPGTCHHACVSWANI